MQADSALTTSSAQVTVTAHGARRARSGHPWIFRDDVLEARAYNGDLCRVVDKQGVHCCWAVFSERSKISLRRVAGNVDEVSIEFWSQALTRALELRAEPRQNPAACCRLLHADADGFPGLVVDRYGEHLVCQATTVWADRVAPALTQQLATLTQARSVLARNDAQVRTLEGLPRHTVQLVGDTPTELDVEEAGLSRRVDPWHGHKTGLYLDQQSNHRDAQTWLSGRVLDLFCAEGGFAVPLAHSGAQVLAIDQSRELIVRGEHTATLHELDARIDWRCANVFDELATLRRDDERFDGVVLDPPPFARGRGARDHAQRGLRDLHRRALELLRPGGRLLSFSCSFAISDQQLEEAARQGAAQAQVELRVLARPGQAPDHPETMSLPESRYLRGLLLQRL